MEPTDIHTFIVSKENEFQHPISLLGWDWSFKDHIKTSFYYKHGRLLEGNDDNTPIKNIVRPILNLQYRAEDIDVKDVLLYVDDADEYHLSFLIKKYHDDVYVIENDLDSFLDETNESKVDYGFSLVRRGSGKQPDVIDPKKIAFCDQTNILSGPIAIKHYFNPSELKEMESRGWGKPENGANGTVDELIKLAREEVEDDDNLGKQNKTPGNYIEVYEVDGVINNSFLTDREDDSYTRQKQIVGFYKINKENKSVILFRKETKENPYKVLKRTYYPGRATGDGGVEELFENIVWTNYSVIQKKEMLDSASKTILKAVGAELKSRYPNGLQDLDNLSIVELSQGEDLAQIDTFPRNVHLFDQFAQEMEENAKLTASAQDPMLGKPAPSGTPFRAQERQVIEGKGIHEYRRGKFSKFIEDIYRTWIIPDMVREMNKGTKFFAELSSEEMQYVADKVVQNEASRENNERVLDGKIPMSEEEMVIFKDAIRLKFSEGGNKRFLEILKDELRNKAVKIKINIAGKQKNVELMTDKLVNIFRQIIANPQGFQQVMQIPGMSKTFNDILEMSGMNPVYYSGILKAPAVAPVNPEVATLYKQLL